MTLPAFASVEAESVDDTVAGLAAAGGADPCHRGRNRAGAVDESSVDPPAVLAGIRGHAALAQSVASAVLFLAVMAIPDASAAAPAARSNGAHKGIGESSIATTAAAVGNALYAALGVQIHDLPIRAVRVFRAMRGAATRHAR
jgi:hypothetical protein